MAQVLSRLRSKASGLVRTYVTERGHESPRYRTLRPCARGGYHRGLDDVSGGTSIIVNSTGGELFAITLSFLDDSWPIYVIDGSDGCYGLPALSHAVENVPTRWGVMLDEDAFVVDNQRLRELVSWAELQGHAAVGVPDGGVVARREHNPNALNLFFNVLDLDAIRRVWNADDCQSWMNRGHEMERAWPPEALLKDGVPYVFDDYEPYYCFYFWLVDAGLSTGYLDARLHSDGLSAVVLDHTSQPVVIHSWYAREFDTPGPMRERILDVIEHARGGPDRGARWQGRF
jgi:hypothetical protein